MGKMDKKPTQKERQYAILILFIATLLAVILLYVMTLSIPSPVPIFLIIGVALIFFIPAALYIYVTKYRQNVYATTCGVIFIFICIVAIVLAVGSYYSRT